MTKIMNLDKGFKYFLDGEIDFDTLFTDED